MSDLELRDHARQILEAIAADLRTTQTREEQTAKSKGLSATAFNPQKLLCNPRGSEGEERFDIKQMVSEYRAPRASVLRLAFEAWAPAEPPVDDLKRPAARMQRMSTYCVAKNCWMFRMLEEIYVCAPTEAASAKRYAAPALY